MFFRLQKYYFNFTRSILLSKAEFNLGLPKKLSGLKYINIIFKVYRDCFVTSNFFISFLLLLSNQVPKIQTGRYGGDIIFIRYASTLNKNKLFQFLDKFINFSLVLNPTSLQLEVVGRDNFKFVIVNPYIFPDLLLLINNQVLHSFNFFFKCLFFCFFNSTYSLKSNLNLLHSLQVPLLSFI